MEGLENLIVGILFIGAIVGGGLLGTHLTRGSWLAIVAGSVLSVIPWSVLVSAMKYAVMRRGDILVQVAVGCLLGVLAVDGLFAWFSTPADCWAAILRPVKAEA